MGRITLIDHARQRIKERLDPDIKEQDILAVLTRKSISENKITFARKETCSRTIIYGQTEKGPFKAIYSKKCKAIITILPMNYIFKTDWIYVNHKEKKYRIIIFPDCLMETHDKKIMTQFEIFENNYWLTCGKKEPLFTEVYDLAVEQFPICKNNGTFA